MEKVELLLTHAEELVTCAALEGVKRGAAMADVGIIKNGAVAVSDGHIVDLGPTAAVTAKYSARQQIDATGHAVTPGFVDPHTHLVYGGDRVAEYELRLRGASYMEIMAAGGGIVSTVAQTRLAEVETLVATARLRLDEMLLLGTTSAEIKSGYGLDIATELKMLRAIEQLDAEHPMDLVPTFLGAHTVPLEYKGDVRGYLSLLLSEMLPAVIDWYAATPFYQRLIPCFIDVFCEDHAFSVDQAREILKAGMAMGLLGKIHVDQFNAMGGVKMAVGLGVHTVDHLDVSGAIEIEQLANSRTICVPLPAANFNLGHTSFAPARALLDGGAALALATDMNPGSAPCFSMPFVMALACRFQGLTPAEALNGATINAAHAIGLGERLGSLEIGKQADMLLLKDADYRYLTYFFGHNPVANVIKRGHLLG